MHVPSVNFLDQGSSKKNRAYVFVCFDFVQILDSELGVFIGFEDIFEPKPRA